MLALHLARAASVILALPLFVTNGDHALRCGWHLLALHLARASSFALALPYCVPVQENSSACSAWGVSLFCCLLVTHALRPAGFVSFAYNKGL